MSDGEELFYFHQLEDSRLREMHQEAFTLGIKTSTQM